MASEQLRVSGWRPPSDFYRAGYVSLVTPFPPYSTCPFPIPETITFFVTLKGELNTFSESLTPFSITDEVRGEVVRLSLENPETDTWNRIAHIKSGTLFVQFRTRWKLFAQFVRCPFANGYQTAAVAHFFNSPRSVSVKLYPSDQGLGNAVQVNNHDTAWFINIDYASTPVGCIVVFSSNNEDKVVSRVIGGIEPADIIAM